MKFIQLALALISVHALAAAPVADGDEKRSLLRGFNSELIEMHQHHPLNPLNCPMPSQVVLDGNPCPDGRKETKSRQTICCSRGGALWVQCWEDCSPFETEDYEEDHAVEVIEES